MTCSLLDVWDPPTQSLFSSVATISDPSLLNLRYTLWFTILIGFAHSSVPFETCGYFNLGTSAVEIHDFCLILLV